MASFRDRLKRDPSYSSPGNPHNRYRGSGFLGLGGYEENPAWWDWEEQNESSREPMNIIKRSMAKADERSDREYRYRIARDKKFDEAYDKSQRAAEKRWQYSKGYMDEQRRRERRRQRTSDRQKKKSLSIMEAIQSRRNELIQDIKEAPSSVMQQASRSYDMMAQNKAAVAGSGGDYRAQREYVDSMGVADANLMNATAGARTQENLSRLGARGALLDKNAQGAMSMYALSTGEGNSFLPALNASASASSGLMGAASLGLAGAGQSGQHAMGYGGQAISGGLGMMNAMNQQRATNLSREKWEFNRAMAPLNALLGFGGEMMKAFIPMPGRGSSSTPG